MIVADFSTPVRIPRSTFEELITRIDVAVGEHGVALSLHEDFPFRSLDPVNPTAIDFTGLDLEDDPLDIVENLDQLIYFAFELASSEDVISWAKEYNSDLEAEAVERVELIRKKMPHLELLWSSKNNSLIPPLVELSYGIINSKRGDACVVYLAAARISSSTGAPDKSDATRIRVQLWPSDVRMLMRELNHVWQAHLSHPDMTTGDKDVDDAGD